LRTRTVFLLQFVLIAGSFGAAAPASAIATDARVPLAQVAASLTHLEPQHTLDYSRDDFKLWIVANGDRCDTRSELLQEQSAVPVTYTVVGGCTVKTGQWTSWYDGATWTNASDVDIDHMVPLKEAWISGAYAWTATQRMEYANDLSFPGALQVVTDNVNQAKGDRDPATWMPPLPSADCQYLTDWVLIKYHWNLAVDSAEQSALTTDLAGDCGATLVSQPTRENTPTPTGGGAILAPTGVDRYSGADRYATAVAISQQYPSGVPVAYIATGTNYPDALSAAPAAAFEGGPLLLTPPNALPANVAQELDRLEPTKIVIVGGTAAVSLNVEAQLASHAATVVRYAGADRFATSQTINRDVFANGASAAFIATGLNFPDALSASAVAGTRAAPVVLVNGASSTLDSGTQALLTQLGTTSVTIAGGTGVVSSSIENDLRSTGGITSVIRYGGSDRYGTSLQINAASYTTAPTAYFATGTGFADALAGAALAARDHAPLYVVPGSCVSQGLIDLLQTQGTTHRVLLGGESVVGAGVGTLTPCATPGTAPGTSIPPNPGDSKNCTDFATWQSAQAWFNTYYPYYGDVARLDADHDRIACESLPGAP